MKPLIFIYLLSSFCSLAQDTTSRPSKITWNAYAELYYGYDFANPASHERPSFLYNHTRHNEVNLNLGFVKASYNSEKIRANLALMAGTYSQYNLAHEQELLRNIFEANAGIKLGKGNLWLDAGIFQSHIGFESAISKDCWTLTRSLVAENSPYYLSGAKLNYITNNEKWLFLLAYVNGWQRIKRVSGQNNPNLSTQIQFKPNSNLILNYSTFIGSDKPDSSMQMHYYHNMYAMWHFRSKIGLILGFDCGMEQRSKGGSGYNQLYALTAIIRYQFTDKIAAGVRYEYYDDQHGLIISTGTIHGFQTNGYSLNLDYKPEDRVLIRIEGRMFDSRDKIFVEGTLFTKQNYAIYSSIAVIMR